MAKKDSQFLLWQKIIVGVVVVTVVGVFGYFYTMVLSETPLGEFVEGEHYQLIDDPRRVRGDKVEVMEFFSYACPHCYDFEPRLNAWADDNRDKVKFVRMPAVGTTYWITLGRAYFTMEELGILEQNHTAMFDEIHRYGHDLGSLGRITAWIDGKGATEAAFTSAFNSSKVNRQMEIADQMARRLKIASVPSVVVNGKYLVQGTREVGLSRMLDVVDYLVAKEMAGKEVAPAEPTAP